MSQSTLFAANPPHDWPCIRIHIDNLEGFPFAQFKQRFIKVFVLHGAQTCQQFCLESTHVIAGRSTS